MNSMNNKYLMILIKGHLTGTCRVNLLQFSESFLITNFPPNFSQALYGR